jgi:hypothetical protein
VKTLAIGTVGEPALEGGEWVMHARELSYFCRLSEAEIFERLALVEIYQGGTETVQTVCAVPDGAEWIQSFVNLHRPDAVRILDLPHALGDLAQTGQVVYGKGTAAFAPWFTTQRQGLKQGELEAVVSSLQR